MISIKPKTRALITINTIEEIVPHLKRVSKNWRSLTPLVNDRLIALLDGNPNYTGMNLFHFDLRKEVLQMRSGTFSRDEYATIFGWSEEEIEKLMDSKGKIFKETCKYTPGQKQFWMTHYGMSEEEAIKKVSEAQTKLSIRKKKTTINQPTSIQYYLYRGMNEDEAVKAQSDVQKKRRNNCIEYWLNKGYSKEKAEEEISKLQKIRSKLSVDYWLYRGYSLDEALTNSHSAQKNTYSGRTSKISEKFFTEVLLILVADKFNTPDFKFGGSEHSIVVNKKRMYLDFIHLPSKKIIEFDGKYWHSKEGAKESDTVRDKLLTELGYSILRIPETYNKMLWNKYLIQAVEFIKEN